MTEGHVDVSYKTYWVAWLVLLALTLVMVFVAQPPVLILGMILKAAIIFLWFMHLRYEKLDLVLSVTVGIFATALILFLLIAPDGTAM